jgi:hypothetical protein
VSKDLIISLCDELGFAWSEEGERSLLRITVPPSIEIEVELGERGGEMRVLLAPLPEEGREVVLSHLMQANYLGQGTGGGVLGIAEESGTITFSRRLQRDIGSKELQERIEEFVNYAEYWREQLENGSISHSR